MLNGHTHESVVRSSCDPRLTNGVLPLQAVHTPLQPPKSYIYPYRHMFNVARRKYAAMVSTVDEAVHNITYALRKLGYYRNSVIVFSTDNGAQPFTGGSNWPLRGRKVRPENSYSVTNYKSN